MSDKPGVAELNAIAELPKIKENIVMAIVKNQDLPLEDIEDKLDPPIPFIEQYRRTLDEGIDHPALPAGEETVTYSKSWSRPATRSEGTSSPTETNQAWRDKFRECLDCWENQVDTEEEVDDCHSAGSRHYVKPWEYVPGAQNTYFNQFMKDCLDWAKANPGKKFPKCEDLEPVPSPFEYCPGEVKNFTVGNGKNPVVVSADCGEKTGDLEVTITADPETCPEECEVKFSDDDGRKGCAEGTKKADEECCCSQEIPLAIVYSTLLMTCGGEQTFTIDPEQAGCEPYTWSLEGGGSIEHTEGDHTKYTAPATNPECALNPTIKLTDSCGVESEIKLAVNCYTSAGEAYRNPYMGTEAGGTGISNVCGSYSGIPKQTCRLYHERRNCDGSWFTMTRITLWQYHFCNFSLYVDCCGAAQQCKASYACVAKSTGAGSAPCCQTPEDTRCSHQTCSADCTTVTDLRSGAMKTAGCCPLNPVTGAPL